MVTAQEWQYCIQQLHQALLDRQQASINLDYRIFWGFVWRRNPGEFLNLASPSLAIKSPRITVFADCKVRGHMSFYETICSENIPCDSTIVSVGGDERCDRYYSGIVEKPGYFCDATDILFAVIWRKSEIATKPMPDIVAIEHVARMSEVVESALQFEGQRGLP